MEEGRRGRAQHGRGRHGGRLRGAGRLLGGCGRSGRGRGRERARGGRGERGRRFWGGRTGGWAPPGRGAQATVGQRGGRAGPRQPTGPMESEGGRGRPRANRAGGGSAGLKGERGDFSFLFSSYFPIIYFISNLLLSAYFMETKQIHTKGNRCVAQHDATTKEKYFQGSPTQDVELILARTLKKNKA
jgi:hypothetical protein